MIMPFDFELAIEAEDLKIGEVRTKSGYIVTELSIEDSSDPTYPVSGYIEYDDYPLYNLWTKEGKFSEDSENDSDLIIHLYGNTL